MGPDYGHNGHPEHLFLHRRVIFGPLAILGVIFGHVAKLKMRTFPDIVGSRLATAGLVIGYALILFWPIGFFFLGAFSSILLGA